MVFVHVCSTFRWEVNHCLLSLLWLYPTPRPPRWKRCNQWKWEMHFHWCSCDSIKVFSIWIFVLKGPMLLERVFHVDFSFFSQAARWVVRCISQSCGSATGASDDKKWNLLFGLLWNVFCWHYLSLSATWKTSWKGKHLKFPICHLHRRWLPRRPVWLPCTRWVGEWRVGWWRWRALRNPSAQSWKSWKAYKLITGPRTLILQGCHIECIGWILGAYVLWRCI